MDRFLKMGSKIGDNRKYVESSFVWNSRGGVKWRRKEEFNGARTTLEKMKEREREGEEKHGWKYCETRSIPTFRIR